MKAAPQEEYDDQTKGFFSRLKDRLGFGQYEDDEEYFDDPTARTRNSVLRVQQARINHVSVWSTLTKLENVRQVADGLKAGHQQIVNLEQAELDERSRITDFLNGVTYALDGSVEKVGDGVYLYAPRHYHIELEDQDDERGRRIHGTFNDN
ncbi:MAG: cell division protein SepF [Armatimonadetes bacterium]|nr:cell division protein SepF [Armatimonadota bacterium]